jgi:hypothetical protein
VIYSQFNRASQVRRPLLYALSSTAVIFQCYGQHECPIIGHSKRCRAGSLSCAGNILESPHHSDSVILFLISSPSHTVFVQCIPHFTRFRCTHTFLRNATVALKENQLYGRKKLKLQLSISDFQCASFMKQRLLFADLLTGGINLPALSAFRSISE